MFDINYIMNGKGKAKKSKDPFSNIFPKQKVSVRKQPNNLMSLFNGKGHPNPLDRQTRQQKVFLRKTRTNTVKRFSDFDGDGVINGLDCMWKNRNKHRLNRLQQERLKKFDITDETLDIPIKTGIKSRGGRILQNTIKQYPKLLTEMEKVPEAKWVFNEDQNIDREDDDESNIHGQYRYLKTDYNDADPSIRIYNTKNKIDRGELMFHEIEHAKSHKFRKDFNELDSSEHELIAETGAGRKLVSHYGPNIKNNEIIFRDYNREEMMPNNPIFVESESETYPRDLSEKNVTFPKPKSLYPSVIASAYKRASTVARKLEQEHEPARTQEAMEETFKEQRTTEEPEPSYTESEPTQEAVMTYYEQDKAHEREELKESNEPEDDENV